MKFSINFNIYRPLLFLIMIFSGSYFKHKHTVHVRTLSADKLHTKHFFAHLIVGDSVGEMDKLTFSLKLRNAITVNLWTDFWGIEISYLLKYKVETFKWERNRLWIPETGPNQVLLIHRYNCTAASLLLLFGLILYTSIFAVVLPFISGGSHWRGLLIIGPISKRRWR